MLSLTCILRRVPLPGWRRWNSSQCHWSLWFKGDTQSGFNGNTAVSVSFTCDRIGVPGEDIPPGVMGEPGSGEPALAYSDGRWFELSSSDKAWATLPRTRWNTRFHRFCEYSQFHSFHMSVSLSLSRLWCFWRSVRYNLRTVFSEVSASTVDYSQSRKYSHILLTIKWSSIPSYYSESSISYVLMASGHTVQTNYLGQCVSDRSRLFHRTQAASLLTVYLSDANNRIRRFKTSSFIHFKFLIWPIGVQ